MEGPLSKWTNVVKGWQYRWFVLDDNTGLLSYYTVSLIPSGGDFHKITKHSLLPLNLRSRKRVNRRRSGSQNNYGAHSVKF